MALRGLTRRRFAVSAACLALRAALRGGSPGTLRAQTPNLSAHPDLAHIDVAVLERNRVLAEAKSALTQPIAPITAFLSPLASKNDFYSQLTTSSPPGNHKNTITGPFRNHAMALRTFSHTVATLTAAYVLTHDKTCAQRAGRHLHAWFVDPSTRMSPQFENAGWAQGSGSPAGLVDAVPLAEIARSTSFLADALPALDPVQTWFAALQTWLNTAPNALIARDAKDHVASSWLLLSAAISRAQRDEIALDACGHRFRKPTLRNQIDEKGAFPQEVATAFPYRNTLFNFDLLAAACQLLSSPFDDLWHFALEDGPGMRSVAAFLYPSIKDRTAWPYIADPQNFDDLPGRRPALLFSGRAFNRPEYVEAWLNAAVPASEPESIAASFPIHQPLLWTTRATHGF